ncbi:MAG: hypothetical protein OQK73_03340 [Gammaproteobacteria bacterium]|nr:hypothetical protein [Gammaproteobacteria bacterium]
MTKYLKIISITLLIMVVAVGLIAGNTDWLEFNNQPKNTVLFPTSVKCDPNKQICESVQGKNKISFALPQMALYLEPFSVNVNTQGFPAENIESISVNFVMSGMNMGVNQVVLSQTARGRWNGTMRLPVCVSGRKDWQAEVSVITQANHYLAKYNFAIVSKP